MPSQHLLTLQLTQSTLVQPNTNLPALSTGRANLPVFAHLAQNRSHVFRLFRRLRFRHHLRRDVRLQESPNNAAEVFAETPRLDTVPAALEALAGV